jgi:nitrite reductase (cytochrome c-552)
LHQQRELQGLHADQEAARILGELIDFSRQAQTMALRFRAPEAPSTERLPREPVQRVIPTGEAFIDPEAG